MHLRNILTSSLTIVCLAGCHRAPPAAESPTRTADRTIFTDSLLHVEKCLPVKAGEDWHHVCTPIDQSVRPKPKPPQQP